MARMGMTVGELIEELQKLPTSEQVYVGHEKVEQVQRVRTYFGESPEGVWLVRLLIEAPIAKHTISRRMGSL